MKILYFILSLLVSFSPLSVVMAREGGTEPLLIFYSPTCPHCQAAQQFLDEMHLEVPELVVKRFDITQAQNIVVLNEVLQEYPEAQRYRGLVPLIFYDGSYFVGFDAGVKERIYNKLMNIETAVPNVFTLPFIGSVDPASYSVPTLSALLGVLDGFNVCSLGALMLVLGMVLKLRERKLVVLYGGLFIAITAFTYGLLIVLWHTLFTAIGPYVGALELVVGAISFAGGVYFLHEYYRFRTQGLTCDAGTGIVVSSTSALLEKAFAGKGIMATLGAVMVFAGVITVVEFPCSAAIPVTFAGFLSTLELSTFGYLSSIAVFMFFYMLDEIVVFAIAVVSMKVWATSTRFVKWSTLVAGIVLVLFGLYYVLGAALLQEQSDTAKEVGAVCDSSATDMTACDPSLAI